MLTPIRLQLDAISKSFSGVKALSEVSLLLPQGASCGLLGENGSGKSTLIKIIAGVHAPDAGRILIDGTGYSRLRPIDSIRHGIRVIYQDLSIFPNLSIAENIALEDQVARAGFWFRRREARRRAGEALAHIGIQLNVDAMAGELPVAERQLVAIARSLAGGARLIIMDEPTAALTANEARSLFSAVNELKRRGVATLFVTHKLEEVSEVADRIVVLRNGRNALECDAAGLDTAAIAAAITGDRAAAGRRKRSFRKDAPPVLQVERLSLDGFFEDISFDLRSGEILGFAGLLGSGLTELGLSLFGALPASSGTIRLSGRAVRLRRIADALDLGIGYVPEDRPREGLFLRQSIATNIIASSTDRLRGRGGLIDRLKEKECVGEWIGRFRIRTPSTALSVDTLSGGNQQRVVLAKWLARSPGILILNGPTAGVDVGSKAEIHSTLEELAAAGMALIVFSNDMPELHRLCDRLLVMRNGTLEQGGPPS